MCNRSFPSAGFFQSILYFLQTTIYNSLITEHNSLHWMGRFHQSCPFFFLQCHWSTLSMQPNSTHRAALLSLSTSHRPRSPQCASVLCHKHEVHVPSHGHWPGSCHDCFIWIICSVWNGSERFPAAQQHQVTYRGCGQIPGPVSSWVSNLLLIVHFWVLRMWTHFTFSECEVCEYCNP